MSEIGSTAFKHCINYRNAEASVSIKAGSPVIFVMSGVEDGFRAVLPTTAGAQKCSTLLAGISINSAPVPPGVCGVAQIWGIYTAAIVTLQDRGASTDDFAEVGSRAIGEELKVDSRNNALVHAGGVIPDVAGILTPFVVLAQTVASYSSIASTSSDTRIVITAGLKVFLRAM